VDFVQSVFGPAIINADRTVTYTPIPNRYGQDFFYYQISDGRGGIALGAVIVVISPVNDPPVAKNDAYIIDEDTR